MRGIALSILFMGSLIEMAIRGEKVDVRTNGIALMAAILIATSICIIFGW